MITLPTWLLALCAGALGGLAAFAIGLVAGRRFVQPDRGRPGASWREALGEPRRFRFRQGYLIDHSPDVGFLLPEPINHLRAWADLADALTDLVPGADGAMARLRETGRAFRLEGTFGRDRLVILGIRDGADVHITLSCADPKASSVRIDGPVLDALEREAAHLAEAMACSPTATWTLDSEDRVVWGNDAYLRLVRRIAGPEAARAWPLPDLFPRGAEAKPGVTRRRLEPRGDAAERHPLWFEVSARGPGSDGLRHHSAQALDGVIRAEEAMRSSIQTLTKTFAHIATGLAIFDRDRKLILFNPAFADMTGLDSVWLARRPDLDAVFESLRPAEPRSERVAFAGWQTMLRNDGEMPGAAFLETWTRPDGTRLRLTARPQSEGAIAMLIEDVEAEAGTRREDRDARKLLGDLLDGMDDAQVVFDRSGRCLYANTAAHRMWPPTRSDHLGTSDDGAPTTIDECLGHWRGAVHAPGIWQELRDFVLGRPDERAEWAEIVWTADRIPLHVRVTPLPDGRTAIAFREGLSVERHAAGWRAGAPPAQAGTSDARDASSAAGSDAPGHPEGEPANAPVGDPSLAAPRHPLDAEEHARRGRQTDPMPAGSRHSASATTAARLLVGAASRADQDATAADLPDAVIAGWQPPLTWGASITSMSSEAASTPEAPRSRDAMRVLRSTSPAHDEGPWAPDMDGRFAADDAAQRSARVMPDAEPGMRHLASRMSADGMEFVSRRAGPA